MSDPAPPPRPPIHLQGVRIDRYGRVEAMDAVAAESARRSVTVFWVYANCVNVAQDDSDYALALEQADFILNDGAGIELAGLLSGRPVLGNLIGTDWIPDFLDRHAGRTPAPSRLFLLGARPHVLDAGIRVVASRWPELDVVGGHHGYFEDPEPVLRQIETARPDTLIVAMGVPRQERFITENWQRLEDAGIRIAMAGGAILDYLTHEVPRAPRWVRTLRSEWLYRVVKEPRRLWRRYLLGNLQFLWLLATAWIKGFPERDQPGADVRT